MRVTVACAGSVALRLPGGVPERADAPALVVYLYGLPARRLPDRTEHACAASADRHFPSGTRWHSLTGVVVQGCGKTHVGEVMRDEYGFALVDADDVRPSQQCPHPPPSTRDDGSQTRETLPGTDQLLWL